MVCARRSLPVRGGFTCRFVEPTLVATTAYSRQNLCILHGCIGVLGPQGCVTIDTITPIGVAQTMGATASGKSMPERSGIEGALYWAARMPASCPRCLAIVRRVHRATCPRGRRCRKGVLTTALRPWSAAARPSAMGRPIRLHLFIGGAGSISPGRQRCPGLGPARRGHQSKQRCATNGHPTPDCSNRPIIGLAMQERRPCI
jgi:hypothetical protein